MSDYRKVEDEEEKRRENKKLLEQKQQKQINSKKIKINYWNTIWNGVWITKPMSDVNFSEQLTKAPIPSLVTGLLISLLSLHVKLPY